MTKKILKKFFQIPFVVLAVVSGVHFSLSGCGVSSDGFYMAAIGFNEGRILVANNLGNPVAYTISMYDLQGNFIQMITDGSLSGFIFRGMAPLDAHSMVVSTDGADELKQLNLLSGELSTYANSSFFAGNLYDIVRQSDGVYLAVETNTIEKFSSQARVPPTGNPYINTTLGSCTISTGRGLAINSQGELLLTSYANSSILRYDISGSTSSCLSANATFGAQQPVPIVVHPNGNLYFGTWANDAIYEAPEDLSGNPSILLSGDVNINNPSAMAVLPNGNLLVASDGTDTIIEMTTAGAVVNSSFIKNAFTSSVNSIYVVPPQ